MEKYARDRNAGVWIEHSDRLYVEAYSSVASLQVVFSGYFRSANGEVREYSVQVNPTSDRAVTSNNVHFGAGFLLSCTAHLQSGNADRGQCYVRARVQRSTGTPLVVMHQILGGYLTDNYSPSFPFGKIEGSLEGPGIFRSVAGTDPAAGAEISETVPTGARWKLRGLIATYVADATVANRRPTCAFDDGTTIFARAAINANLTASQSPVISFIPSGAAENVSGSIVTGAIPPDLALSAAFRIRTVTVNLQAGDNWGAPQLIVEEWLEA